MLTRSFFARKTQIVARELLGKLLVHETREAVRIGMIVETEAYLGSRDPGSHAYRRTPRSSIMFGQPGHAYIYLAYGNHWMFNIVTEKPGRPGAVLVRALQPLAGIKLMQRARRVRSIKNLTNGPGKLTKALGIDKRYNGYDLCRPCAPDRLYLAQGISGFKIVRTTRIGLTKGKELKLRFYIKGNPFVSRY